MMTNLNATSVVDPVKIILERHVHPGAENAFQGWAERYVAAARRFPNHQGSSVLSTSSGGSHFILLRFASSKDLDAWQHSAEATSLLVILDLDRPFGGLAKIDPTAMRTAEQQIGAMPFGDNPPCDASGAPVGGS